jgi:hypothetical protein
MSDVPGLEPSGRLPRLPAAPKVRRKTAKAEETEIADKTGRRTWRGYVLWAVMALLVLAAAAEFRAQTAYRKTLSTCQTAVEGKNEAEVKQITFDELKGSLPADPVYTKEVHSFVVTGVYTWTWQGLRRYKVHLFVNPKDGKVWDVKTEP